MTQVILFTNQDGACCLMHPCTNVYVPIGSIPVPEDFVTFEIPQDNFRLATAEEIAARDVPKLNGTNWNVINREDILCDTDFFAAWVNNNGVVTVDMDRAREVHKDVLRELRSPELSLLDVSYMKADEIGDTATKLSIAARKKALRDVTKDPAIAAAGTTDDLKIAGINTINGV